MIAVFDSSSLISLSQSCLINLLKELKENSNAAFVVPKSVFFEVVERPLGIKRFELNAVRLQKAVGEGWLQVKELDRQHKKVAFEIGERANNMLFINGKPVRLIQRGEIEALALTKQLGARLLVIDERTTRAILENPLQLKELIERRRQKKAEINWQNANELQQMFHGLSIVRSVEMIALAFERRLVGKELPEGKRSLEAALYAAKYAGCAVSGVEIENFLSGQKK